MSESRLQEPFLRELVSTFQATKSRILNRLAEVVGEDAEYVLEEELRGLYHGLLVILDGGSGLADKGLVRLVDEEGVEFNRYLHEICLTYWPAKPDQQTS